MTLPARPLLDVMRGIAEECESPEECLEVAVAREYLPQSVIGDERRRFRCFPVKTSFVDVPDGVLRAVPSTKRDFVKWSSLGWETIAEAEALAAEHHAERRVRRELGVVSWSTKGRGESGVWPSVQRLRSLGIGVSLEGDNIDLLYPIGNDTGNAGIDRILDTTFHPRSVVLITGTAGSGKTTLAAMLCAGAAVDTFRAYYGTREEPSDVVRRSAERQGYPRDNYPIVSESVRGILTDALGDYRAELLVVDGIHRGGSVANVKRAVANAKHDCAAYVTTHVNKNGSIVNGADVFNADAVLELSLRENELVVTAMKNRYGRAPVELASFRRGNNGRWTPEEQP